MDEDVVMEFGQRMAALLNECPSDIGFGLLIRFTVSAAEQMTDGEDEAVGLIMRSVMLDLETVPSRKA